ncbi:MAG: phage major capsid protein [Oscillospiraceae bacterium]|nr:phage major capsid protein [Oscillospiraceae bacterium]
MYFDNLKLEKGMYNVAGKSFTEVLEELDCSKNYENTPYANLDAYQRQLKRFDIKVSGTNSDAVEKFFKTTDSAALFPEYVARAVKQGMEEANILNEIVATKTNISGLDYRTITSTPVEPDTSVDTEDGIAEGAEIPEVSIKTKDNLIKLKKRGRMLVSSYEAVRNQRLDLFTVTLKQIGAYIAKAQLADAISVLMNGDGNDNAAAQTNKAGSDFAYTDLLALWSALEPHELNTMLVSPDAMLSMLSFEEFKNPLTGLNFAGTGKLSTPIGATMFKSNSVPSGTIIGLDKKCALEMVTLDDIVIDYDKLINRQLERTAVTSTAGFAKIFTDASHILKI